MGSIDFGKWLNDKHNDESWSMLLSHVRNTIEEAAWQGWKGRAALNAKEMVDISDNTPQLAIAHNLLKDALFVINYMGEILNGLDMVLPEDMALCNERIKKLTDYVQQQA
jgi:hypothetical protein